MGRLRGHARLRENEKLYVLVPGLKHGDHVFEVGEDFPWHRMEGITARLVRQLWEQHKIGHEDPNEPPKGAEPAWRSPTEVARHNAKVKAERLAERERLKQLGKVRGLG